MAEDWADVNSDQSGDSQKPLTRKRGRGSVSNIAGEDQKTRRLEKNRQSAKESRLRKKYYMQNLEDKNSILEKEKAKLLRKINQLEEREKLNYLSHVDTVDQLLQGRQDLYDRLELSLEEGGTKAEINTIIAQLRIRSGSYGTERKNLVNNLFKSIIDLSFPNIVKYMFWACEHDTGIFEELNEEDLAKYKRMSKYKKEEIAAKNNNKFNEEEDEY